MEEQEIFDRALRGDKTILDECTDEELQMPLDKHGWTALHYLAQARHGSLIKNPLSYTTLNGRNETPVKMLIRNCDITRDAIQKYFPWYTPKTETESIELSLFNIQQMSNAEQFILESFFESNTKK